MVFSSPSFLWALGLVIIPIIIHLFQFRRYKKLYFSDISLLKSIKSQSQTKNQLKHLLILLSRIILISLLVLAFARPIIPTNDGNKERVNLVSMYIDNSFSMQAEDASGPLLNQAIQTAFDIAEDYPESMRFQLITNDFQAPSKRIMSRQDIEKRLDEISSSPDHRTIADVLRFQSQSEANEIDQIETYLISDFNNMIPSEGITVDSNNNLTLVALRGRAVNNITVDSSWLATPLTQTGFEQTVFFRAHNYGSDPVIDQRFDVYLNEQLIASPILTIEPMDFADSSFSFIPEEQGYLEGIIQVEDRPVTYDNQHYFALKAISRLKAVEIKGTQLPTSSVFERLFSGKNFKLTSFSEKAIIQDSLQNTDLLVLNQVEEWSSGLEAICRQQLESGANVLFVMPKNTNEALNEGLSKAFRFEIQRYDSINAMVQEIAYDHPLFLNVFEKKTENLNLPQVSGAYKLRLNSFSDNLMPLPNGQSLLAANNVGNGVVFLITSPLNTSSTNLQQHALFVPSVINMAAFSGIEQPLSYLVETERIPSDHNQEGVYLESKEDSLSFLPGISYDGLLLNDQVTDAGIYYLREASQTNHNLAVYAFNHNRSESKIRPPDVTELKGFFDRNGIDIQLKSNESPNFSEEVASANLGTELWPLFILLALAVMLSETLLLKLFSR